jgi:hypothetical protein
MCAVIRLAGSKNARKVWSAGGRGLESASHFGSMVTKILFPICLTALAVGCSVLIDVDAKQCKTNADCASLATAGTSLECRQNLCVAVEANQGDGGAAGASSSDPLVCEPIELSTEPTVKYSFAPIFVDPPADPKPFSIKACLQLDLTCERPVFGPIDVNAGEPQDFEVAPGFTGYFEISNPDTVDGLLFLGRPVQKDTVGWNVSMPSPDVVTQLAFATGKVVDPELGLILSVARDCNAVALEGVTFSNSEENNGPPPDDGKPPLLGYYFVNSLPNTTLTKTGPQGAAGYANVRTGTAVLSGTTDSGTALGPLSVRVKPKTLSFGEIFP